MSNNESQRDYYTVPNWRTLKRWDIQQNATCDSELDPLAIKDFIGTTGGTQMGCED